MVTGYTYSTYVAQLATLAVVDPTDTNFVQNLPSVIDSAELRIMQDLDLLSTKTSQVFQLSAGNRAYSFSIGAFVVTEQVNILTPNGASNPEAATRNPCTFVDKTVLDALWPSSTGATVPSLVALFNQNTLRFGPWPDQAYFFELVGTARPASLSASNTTTFISTYLPDLFMAASMVYIAGYQRNFGSQADDPKLAVSWMAFYKDRLQAAMQEEGRKKFQASAWTSLSLPVTATPDRGMYPKAA